MSSTTPIQSLPIPTTTDTPDVVRDIAALANAVEKRLFGVYNSVSDRDTRITSPQEGMVAYTKDTDFTYMYNGTAWVRWPAVAPAITSGTTVPSNGSGADGDIYFKV